MMMENEVAINDDESHSSSLSDCHDCEPQLEFDDTELEHTADLEKEDSGEYVESPVSDGTIDENFEEQIGFDPPPLKMAIENGEEAQDFSDIAKYGIVEVAGDDYSGRKVIVISACKLPSNKTFDHDRFFRYLMYTLDQYVESDYSLIYFHHGLTSKNKPSISWLWQAYKTFDRKYKKNLKALFLVHPTNFIKVLWGIFKPAISVKFGRKVMYVNYLHELKQHLRIDQLYIPQSVLEHDIQLMSKSKLTSSQSATFHTPIDTQQFKVSLQFLKERNNGEPIPLVVRKCVEYLQNPDMMETEGLFRRSANQAVVREIQIAFNSGVDVDFSRYCDPHLAAVLLKLFLRELPEPLLTFDLYNDIIGFQRLSKSERLEVARIMILHRLPDDNYELLKYIVDFLAALMDRSDLNKMTASNLAIVFGPNLVWSLNQQASLLSMGPINHFADYILGHHEQIFIK
ncbi:hypothetical protein CHUAL_000399 [Chamberlinius hualienensis]